MLSNSFKIFLMWTLLGSCQHRTKDLNPTDKAEQMINERRYAEAISLLEDDSLQDESGRRTLLLASAYAGSAGVNLIDSYSFFSGFLVDSGQMPKKPKKTTDKNSTNKDSLQFLSQTIQAYLMTLASDSRLLLSVPHLSAGNRSSLNEAILTAGKTKTDQEYYSRARQYLVFLNLIQFGNYMKDVFPKVDFSASVTSIDLICGLEPQSFVLSFESAINSFSAAIDALDDLQKVKPLKIKSQIEDLKDIVSSLQSQLNILRPNLNDVTLMLNGMQQGYCT